MEEKRMPTGEQLKTIARNLGVSVDENTTFKSFICEEGGSEYAVWLVESGEEKYVLKQAKAFETEVGRCFFSEKRAYRAPTHKEVLEERCSSH